MRKTQSLRLSLKSETLTRLDLGASTGASVSGCAPAYTAPTYTLPMNTYMPGEFTYGCPTGGNPIEN